MVVWRVDVRTPFFCVEYLCLWFVMLKCSWLCLAKSWIFKNWKRKWIWNMVVFQQSEWVSWDVSQDRLMLGKNGLCEVSWRCFRLECGFVLRRFMIWAYDALMCVKCDFLCICFVNWCIVCVMVCWFELVVIWWRKRRWVLATDCRW